MKEEVKDTVIAELGEKLKSYSYFCAVDVAGLNAEATSSLRRKYFKSEINMVVMRDSLLHKVFEALDIDFELLYGSLKDNTAVMLSQTANIPAELLKEYKREGTPAPKAIYAEESLFIDAGKLKELVTFKNGNELITDAVVLLQSPAENVVSVLQLGTGATHGALRTLGERPE